MKFKGNVTYLEGKLLIPILVEMYFLVQVVYKSSHDIQ